MVVHVYGFDWSVYAERVMPAFERWLIEKDEDAVFQLFSQTRCAREEQFLPEPMQKLRVWPRARDFVSLLPRGPHSRKEYAKLCSANAYTALSDSYTHNYAPHLYQNSNALRSVWGAIIEEYCLPWLQLEPTPDNSNVRVPAGQSANEAENASHDSTMREEMISLLQEVGLGNLVEDGDEPSPEIEPFDLITLEQEAGQDKSPAPGLEAQDEDEDEDSLFARKSRGTIIGQHVHALHLRGWLAGYSVQAMALFEYLTLGRRSMPFGYEAGEPYGAYIGYLTPDEVWRLASRLHNATLPGKAEAEKDYQLFIQQQKSRQDSTFRVIDEVQPLYAEEFLQAVRQAALQGLGLICSTD